MPFLEFSGRIYIKKNCISESYSEMPDVFNSESFKTAADNTIFDRHFQGGQGSSCLLVTLKNDKIFQNTIC